MLRPIFTAGALLCATCAAACAEPASPAPPPPVASAGAIEKATDTVQLTADGVKSGNIRIATVQSRTVVESARVPGSIQAQGDRLVNISSRTTGQLEEILVQVGSHVARGEVLARLVSPDLAQVQSSYQQAILSESQSELSLNKQLAQAKLAREQARVKLDVSQRQKERTKGLHADGIVPRQDMEAAVATWRQNQLALQDVELQLHDAESGSAAKELAKARQTKVASADRIRLLGGSLDRTDGVIPVVSPIAGKVISREVTRGQGVEANALLFKVLDVTRLLVVLEVPESVALVTAAGTDVEFSTDALSGRTFRSLVGDVDDLVDPSTRKIKVRCSTDNPDGLLRPGMFVTAVLRTGRAQAVTVPLSALQSVEDKDVVFVALGQERFRMRSVTVRTRASGQATISEGLVAGEHVVVDGAFWLKSEIEKGQLEE